MSKCPSCHLSKSLILICWWHPFPSISDPLSEQEVVSHAELSLKSPYGSIHLNGSVYSKNERLQGAAQAALVCCDAAPFHTCCIPIIFMYKHCSITLHHQQELFLLHTACLCSHVSHVMCVQDLIIQFPFFHSPPGMMCLCHKPTSPQNYTLIKK